MQTLEWIKARGVAFCCDCDEFPCPLLGPVADGVSRYPHNMKLYNLCQIKKVGLERWIEQAGQIRKKLFYRKNSLSGEGRRITFESIEK